MKNHDKTRTQLVNELVILRKEIAEFKISEAQRKKAEDLLKKVVTKSERAYETMKESETRYRRLFETAQDGILILDGQTGQITDVNPFLINMLGYSHKELLRKQLWEIGTFQDIASSQAAFSELQDKGYIRYEDLPLETKGGSKMNVEFVSNVYLVNGNKVIQCNIRDITKRKKAESKLSYLTDNLKRSNTDLQQFAYAASHDLQAPLRNIEGFVKLFERRYRKQFDEKADELIDFIIEGVIDMQSLISDLLEYSQIETKGKKFKLVDSSLSVAQAMADVESFIEETGAEVSYDDPLPKVLADKSQLRRLFQNLIGNALKFRSKRNPKVNISAQQKDKKWLFSVSDNGIGMEPKDTERIFNAFQRLHGKTEYPGTGIGLALCKKIVERHGGSIWVESEFGKGSTFYFTIPTMEKQT
jgi:PAS domain S-box-containing protein